MFLSPFLRRRLVRPLCIAAAAAFLAAIWIPWGGLFVNLGTTLLGIVITIGYVDLVLRQHESDRWIETKARIAKRLEQVANVASAQFRSAFGIPPEVYRSTIVAFADGPTRRAELSRVTRDLILPAVPEAIARLDEKAWKQLAEQLRITWQNADHLLQLFGSHLEPRMITLLLDLQDRMRSFLDNYTTFPDVLGIPESKLQPNLKGESSSPLQRELLTMAAVDCDSILHLSLALLAALDAAGAA